MKELLEKWAELEPERCVLSHGNYYYSGEKWNCMMTEDSCVNLPEIQYAIQQAIEARGWDWIKLSGNINILDNDNLIIGHVRLTDSFAHDLLSAYLSALEATKTQEVVG